MKKLYITAFSLIILISILIVYIFYMIGIIKNSNTDIIKMPQKLNSNYEIFVDDNSISKHTNFIDATREANLLENSYIVDLNSGERIWHNNPEFVVIDGNSNSYDFIFYKDAIKYAKTLENSKVLHLHTRSTVWDSNPIAVSATLKAPLILQLPELARGCEVTSLAMLLQHADVDVNKMKLAKEIKKDTTPYETIDGKVHFGNPHIGFVGDIYNFSNYGYGVYIEPLFDLLNQYLHNQAINLTKTDFEDILYFVSKGYPVLVITNSTYNVLPENQFQTWSTNYGEIDITYREHSVLITGYDENYIYFNDPLNYSSYAKRNEFIDAWEQMGSQALTYINYKNNVR